VPETVDSGNIKYAETVTFLVTFWWHSGGVRRPWVGGWETVDSGVVD